LDTPSYARFLYDYPLLESRINFDLNFMQIVGYIGLVWKKKKWNTIDNF